MKKTLSLICFALMLFGGAAVSGQDRTFTYQGFLRDGGAPANGNYDMKFDFYPAETGGASVNSQTRTAVPVSNGVFSVELIGNPQLFAPDGALYVGVSVRPAGGNGAYTPLAPRRPVGAAPYSISALQADNALRLGGQLSNQFLTIPTAQATFIQNGATPQSGGFNLNGTGTANVLNAATQFDLGGGRILSAPGTDNFFAGLGAGQSNTTGASNAFFGRNAGSFVTTGSVNSFFGASAGQTATTGFANSFFGGFAGFNTTTGGNNSFFGAEAGFSNQTGSFNTMIGNVANPTAGNLTNATAIGWRASVARSNALVLGAISGVNGANVSTDVGIGTNAPQARLHIVGGGIGRNLIVSDNNPLVTNFDLINSSANGRSWRFQSLGGQETTRAGNFEIWEVNLGNRMTIRPNGAVGFGTLTPAARLQVGGDGFGGNGLFTDNNTFATTLDIANTSTGGRTWRLESRGSSDATRAGSLEIWNVGGANAFAIRPNGDFGLGTLAPQARLHVVGTSLFSGASTFAGASTFNGPLNYFAGAGNANFFIKAGGAPNGINFGVAGNAGSNSTLFVSQYDGTTFQDRLIIDQNGNTSVTKKLSVGIPNPGFISVALEAYGAGFFSFVTPPSGTNFAVCGLLTGLDGAYAQMTKCGISSIRYKNNVKDLPSGLEIVRKLRAVSFDWKANNSPDVGFIAEEVAEVEPQLTMYTPDKQIEGVRYEKLGVYLVKAAQEQQDQIESQRKEIDEQKEIIERQQTQLDRQQAEIDALKALVCAQNKDAAVCRERKP